MTFGGFQADSRRLPAYAMHYYFNYADATVSLRYPYADGSDLLTDTAVGHAEELRIDPWGMLCIEER